MLEFKFDTQLLLSGDRIEEAEPSLFVDPGRDTLLQSVQSDILEFRAPPRENKQRIDAADCSITIHACPGPMREAQVLHDLVRGALEFKDGGFLPLGKQCVPGINEAGNSHANQQQGHGQNHEQRKRLL